MIQFVKYQAYFYSQILYHLDEPMTCHETPNH